MTDHQVHSSIADLKARMKTAEDGQAEFKTDLRAIFVKLDGISKEYANRLPNWGTALLTLLTSACVGLIVRALS